MKLEWIPAIRGYLLLYSYYEEFRLSAEHSCTCEVPKYRTNWLLFENLVPVFRDEPARDPEWRNPPNRFHGHSKPPECWTNPINFCRSAWLVKMLGHKNSTKTHGLITPEAGKNKVGAQCFNNSILCGSSFCYSAQTCSVDCLIESALREREKDKKWVTENSSATNLTWYFLYHVETSNETLFPGMVVSKNCGNVFLQNKSWKKTSNLKWR